MAATEESFAPEARMPPLALRNEDGAARSAPASSSSPVSSSSSRSSSSSSPPVPNERADRCCCCCCSRCILALAAAALRAAGERTGGTPAPPSSSSSSSASTANLRRNCRLPLFIEKKVASRFSSPLCRPRLTLSREGLLRIPLLAALLSSSPPARSASRCSDTP